MKGAHRAGVRDLVMRLCHARLIAGALFSYLVGGCGVQDVAEPLVAAFASPLQRYCLTSAAVAAGDDTKRDV